MSHYFLQKEEVVFPLKKNSLSVISLIKDVKQMT